MEFEPMNLSNEVIEFDMTGFGDNDDDDDDVGIDIVHPVEDDEEFVDIDSSFPVTAPAASMDPYIPGGDTIIEPCKGMDFESEEAAKAFYNSYARRVGFSTRVSMSRRSRRDGAIIQRSFVCAKEGFRVEKERNPLDGRVKRPRAETRVGCKAMLVVKIQDGSRWVVTSFVKEHNHELVPPDKVHCLRSHRHVSGPAKLLIDTLQEAGIGPSGIMSALIKEYGAISNIGFTEQDCRNYIKSSKQRTLGGDTRILFDYLKSKRAEDPSFFYAVVGGSEDRCMSNFLWIDPKARTNYSYFCDTVTFDTTYRSNRFRLPFAPFTGVNNHGQPVLFGCAFLVNESEVAFVWLFKTWLEAMSRRLPVSITTDYDRVIRSAIKRVFPDTRHRFCKWHIFKECQEKLSHVLSEHHNFEADLHKCVNLTESIEEFETCWSSLIDRYDLREDEWLKAIYDDRRQWVPVYMRDLFFAETSITQQSDSINSYFDGYINASTTLQFFVKQYEKALESRYEKEIKADYDTINTAPVLKTPSPMEKQAAEVYTRKLFSKFQEELVETLTFLANKVDEEEMNIVYRVAKYGENHKAYFVKFNCFEAKATCSCQMFEFSGIVCRHILTVFRVNNLLTLPSHYILKRWSRNAKSGVILDERTTDLSNDALESLSTRYNNLHHETLKYVDEAVKSPKVFDVSTSALREAANKVALASKSGERLVTSKETCNEDLHQSKEATASCSDTQLSSQLSSSEDDLHRTIEKLTRQLDRAQRKCEVYRSNLVAILKYIEEQKLEFSVKVQNIKLQMKD